MTRAEQREQLWLRRGIATLVVLALALMVVTTYSVMLTSQDRAAAAARAERTADNLRLLAQSLDAQAAQLEQQAAALERQAARAEQSRRQFRRAAAEILRRLGADVDAFAEQARTTSTVAPRPYPPPDQTGTSSHSVTNETGTSSHVAPPPGCQSNGKGPARCDDDG